MSVSIIEYLRHILDEVNYLMENAVGMKPGDFANDGTRSRAVVRSLEIIGEATKKIPEDFRAKYSAVEWKAIAGMRDKLIHDYFGIDYELVADVLNNRIPYLKIQVEEIIKKEDAA